MSNLKFKVVDLTHLLDENIPIWPGDPQFKLIGFASYDNDGYLTHLLDVGEHSGTHWGTPNTFVKGGRSAGLFTAEELVVPAVVIDIRDKVCHDRDYRLSIGDVMAWETDNGMIPSGSMVILFTGWQDKWNDPRMFFGMDDKNVMHWPGFGREVVDYMIQERGIVGLGTDTHGADPGNEEQFKASCAIYGADGMVLECLTGLDQLPPVGATLVIGGLPIKNGTGSPARVIAFL